MPLSSEVCGLRSLSAPLCSQLVIDVVLLCHMDTCSRHKLFTTGLPVLSVPDLGQEPLKP